MTQDYFWTPEWQEAEKEADEDIRAGRVQRFDSVEDLFRDLDSDISNHSYPVGET